MSQARLVLPARLAPGDVALVRLLIQHPMETGYRQDMDGRLIPRNVITLVSCEFAGVEVFRAEPSPGLAANPLLEFPVRLSGSGEWRIRWVDDQGVAGELRQYTQVG